MDSSLPCSILPRELAKNTKVSLALEDAIACIRCCRTLQATFEQSSVRGHVDRLSANVAGATLRCVIDQFCEVLYFPLHPCCHFFLVTTRNSLRKALLTPSVRQPLTLLCAKSVRAVRVGLFAFPRFSYYRPRPGWIFPYEFQ